VTIEVLFFIANGRPDDLFGCLDSYVQNAAQCGRSPRFVVIDPTLDAAQRNASRDVAVRIHRSRKVNVECITGREVERFIARASKYSWVDVPSMTYALLGDDQVDSKYGAACNMASLLAGGAKSLVVSAATRCNVVGSPGGGPNRVDVPPGGRRTFRALHSDMEQLRFSDSIGSISNEYPRLMDFDLIDEIDRSLSMCNAVSLGTWGDIGVESPGFLALSHQAASISASDDTYARCRLNRIVHRASSVPHLGEVNLRSLAFGSSNAMAPFLPTESAFGGIAGQSMFGHLIHRQTGKTMTVPYAVKNFPSSAQSFLFEDATETPRKVSLTDFLAVMIDSLGSQVQLADIGRGLVAAASDHSFIARTARIWGQYISESAQARSVGACPVQQADLSAIARAGVLALEAPYRRSMGRQGVIDGFVPFEFRSGPFAVQACEVFVRQVVKFGKLLTGWADLVAAFSDLGKNGVRPGVYI